MAGLGFQTFSEAAFIKGHSCTMAPSIKDSRPISRIHLKTINPISRLCSKALSPRTGATLASYTSTKLIKPIDRYQYEFHLSWATAPGHTACPFLRLPYFLPPQHSSAGTIPPNIANTPNPRRSTRQKMGCYGGLLRLGHWSWSAAER